MPLKGKWTSACRSPSTGRSASAWRRRAQLPFHATRHRRGVGGPAIAFVDPAFGGPPSQWRHSNRRVQPLNAGAQRSVGPALRRQVEGSALCVRSPASGEDDDRADERAVARHGGADHRRSRQSDRQADLCRPGGERWSAPGLGRGSGRMHERSEAGRSPTEIVQHRYASRPPRGRHRSRVGELTIACVWPGTRAGFPWRAAGLSQGRLSVLRLRDSIGAPNPAGDACAPF